MSYYDHANEYVLQEQRQLSCRKFKTWEREKQEAEWRVAKGYSRCDVDSKTVNVKIKKTRVKDKTAEK